MSAKGSAIAALAAGMFLASVPVVAGAKSTAKVHCEGVNSCKGKGSCHSANNGCSGQNSCKGKGWIELTAKKCKAKGGKSAPASGAEMK